ncbi:hypothetical protein Trydic_g21089 [Trypoxylus dichotomus]
MVLIRTNKDKIVELITATLHKYLSETQIAKNRSTFENICAKINQSLKGVSDRLEAKIISLENENTKLRERLNDYEQYTRREEEEGNADSTTKDTLDKMEIDTESYIDRCYRVARELEKDVNNAKGAPKKNVNRRCIIVKFTPYYKRNDGSKNKKLLKGLGISISEGVYIVWEHRMRMVHAASSVPLITLVICPKHQNASNLITLSMSCFLHKVLISE